MQQGVENMQSQSAGEELISCRSLYRLAAYADHLYRAADDRFNSQEWRTGQDVIEQKQAEVCIALAFIFQPLAVLGEGPFLFLSQGDARRRQACIA